MTWPVKGVFKTLIAPETNESKVYILNNFPVKYLHGLYNLVIKWAYPVYLATSKIYVY